MKRATIPALLLMLVAYQAAFSQAGGDASEAAGLEPSGWYIGWNPLAALAWCDLGFGNAILPIFANLEYGLAVSAGYRLDAQLFELRLSEGTSSGVFNVFMLQGTYGYELFSLFSGSLGVYAGASLRLWSLANALTGVGTFNIGPNACLGCSLRFDGWFLDFRLSQSVFVTSFSNQAHTSGATAWLFSPLPKVSPVMPTFGASVALEL